MERGDAVPDGVVTMDSPEGSWAWVALDVGPSSALGRTHAYRDASEPERQREAQAAEMSWLAAQWRMDGYPRFELRCVSAGLLPDGGAEPLACVLLGQVSGPSRGGAVRAAVDLRTRLEAAPPHVETRPVLDTAEILRRLEPFSPAPGGLAEIRKRLTVSRCTRADTGRQFCFAISPFVSGDRSWEPVWARLAEQRYPTMVSLLLEPYPIGEGMTIRLQRLDREYAVLAAPAATHPLYGRSAPPDPFAVQAWPLYADAVRRYTDRTFRVRVSVASAGPLCPSFAQAVAGVISPPVPGGAFAGGAATVVSPPPWEFGAAWSNLAAVNRDWLDETYRQGTPPGKLSDAERVLCDLADLSEAAAVFRFPYAHPGRRPLFRRIPPRHDAPPTPSEPQYGGPGGPRPRSPSFE